MYTNISTLLARKTIKLFLDNNPDLVRRAKVIKYALLEALRIVMTQIIFKFGDTYWCQISGTAMGTPPAPAYATLYFTIHEITFVQSTPEIIYYVRYLEDCLGIWHDTPATTSDYPKYPRLINLGATTPPTQP